MNHHAFLSHQQGNAANSSMRDKASELLVLRFTWRRASKVLQLYRLHMLLSGALNLSPRTGHTFIKPANVCILRMAEGLCRALKGETEVRECTFVYLPDIPGSKEIVEAVGEEYFSAPVEFTASKGDAMCREHRHEKLLTHLQVDGAGKITNPLKRLSEKEDSMVKEGMESLTTDISLGTNLGKRFGNDS